MQFEEAVQYLLSLGHETLTIKLGLRNTELLLHSLGNPHRAFSAVQIAGTNGKGSTAAMLDSITRSAGIKTGLYTSPHLTSITERIKLDGLDISEEEFAQHATTVRSESEKLVAEGQLATLPTFFEQVTAIALIAFREAGVELTVLETGLGGRLDSTTAAEASLIGITPIAMDHEEYLGNSIQSISAEKAATIREGVSAVIGKQPPEAMEVLLKRCQDVGVQPETKGLEFIVDDISPQGRYCVTFSSTNTTYNRVRLSLPGRHQIENAALAIQLAEKLRANFQIGNDAIVKGVETAKHPGRLELLSHHPSILLDGAHNPAGVLSLREYLERFASRPLTLVFGAMRDKALEQLAETLFPLADQVIVTMIQNPRSASMNTLETVADKYSASAPLKCESSSEALREAVSLTSKDGTVCITGSLYLIGEIRAEALRLARLETK